MKRDIYINFLVILFIVFSVYCPICAQTFNTYSQLNTAYNQLNTHYWGREPSFTASYSGNFGGYSPGVSAFSGFSGLGQHSFSSWYNHSPIMSYGPEIPMVFNAGQTGFTSFYVMDPDYEQFYTSSSLGATGRAPDGTPIWSFSTNFPGVYSMSTAFYDIRGGYSIMSVPAVVKPWWSF